VIEGCKLKTGKDGRAEVEFEDGSALRLAPDTEVDFTHLALGDDGRSSAPRSSSPAPCTPIFTRKTYGKDKKKQATSFS